MESFIIKHQFTFNLAYTIFNVDIVSYFIEYKIDTGGIIWARKGEILYTGYDLDSNFIQYTGRSLGNEYNVDGTLAYKSVCYWDTFRYETITGLEVLNKPENAVKVNDKEWFIYENNFISGEVK